MVRKSPKAEHTAPTPTDPVDPTAVASIAMHALITRHGDELTPDQIAEKAFAYADAMGEAERRRG